jgi:prevent-host-death family protein
MKTLSKARFKARALEHLRDVERTGAEIVITDHGRPVVKVVPYREEPLAALRSLRGSVRKFIDPLEPATSPDEWEALR